MVDLHSVTVAVPVRLRGPPSFSVFREFHMPNPVNKRELQPSPGLFRTNDQPVTCHLIIPAS